MHAGSLRSQFAAASRARSCRRLYVLGKMLNPRYSVYRAIERRQYAPDRTGPGHRGQQHGQAAPPAVPPRPAQRIHVVPNAIDPERVKVSQPGAVRCAFRNRLGLEPADLVGLFVGHNFALKGLRPLLQALGARNRAAPGRSTCWSAAADTLAFSPAGEVAGDRPGGPFPRLPPRHPRMLRVERLLRPADLLRPLLARGAGSPGLRAARHHNAAERCQRADDRRPAGLRPDRTRRPGRADRRARPHDRRLAPQAPCRPRRPGSVASRPSTATSALIKVFQEVAASRNNHRSHGKLGGSKPHGSSRARAGSTANRHDQRVRAEACTAPVSTDRDRPREGTFRR